jgi:Zn-dependent peptidase ImmA (M78 family)
MVRNFEVIEAVAAEARHKWNLGEAPLPDITELLEEHGIKVLLLPLPEAVSGLTCLVERPNQPPVPVIVVNKTYNLERRRFTLLHELGHRLIQVEGVDEEKAAHRFASAFLMPAAHLRETVGKHRHGFGLPEIIATKRMYGVAASALLVRFRDLGIISQEQLVALFQTTARTWRKQEPGPMPTELGIEMPQRFRRLCYRALAEKMISVTKTADLLQEPVALIAKEMRGEAEDCRQ